MNSVPGVMQLESNRGAEGRTSPFWKKLSESNSTDSRKLFSWLEDNHDSQLIMKIPPHRSNITS